LSLPIDIFIMIDRTNVFRRRSVSVGVEVSALDAVAARLLLRTEAIFREWVEHEQAVEMVLL
jgi:hypothetical protein